MDPDPRVSGAGLEFLKSKGIEVEVGVQRAKCLELNRPFIFRVLNKRSYATCWLTLPGEGRKDNNEIFTNLRMLAEMSPVSDIIILSMDQAVLSIEAAGGAAQWRDLITSLSPTSQ